MVACPPPAAVFGTWLLVKGGEVEELGSSTSDDPIPDEVTVVAMLCVEEVVGLLSTHVPTASSILEWWLLLWLWWLGVVEGLLFPTVIIIALLLAQAALEGRGRTRERRLDG